MSSRIQSIYDVPLLTALARHRAITQRVIAFQFARRLGRDPSHILACVRQLRDRGLVETWPITPGFGNRSQKAVSLTAAGRGWLFPLPVDPDERDPRALHEAERDHLLQRAFVRLSHEHEGWTCLAPSEVFDALKRRAVTVVGRGTDRHRKLELLRPLQRLTAMDIELEGLTDAQGRVKLLLPVRQGKSYRRVLDLLVGTRRPDGTIQPDPVRRATLGLLNAVEPLIITLVAAYEGEANDAAKTLTRWTGRYRLAGTADRVHPYKHVRPVYR